MVRTQARTLWESLWQPGTVPVKSLAQFGEAFFYSFVAVQFVAVLLFTPICAAGAITEEKERRTLEFVLASVQTAEQIIAKCKIPTIAQEVMVELLYRGAAPGTQAGRQQPSTVASPETDKDAVVQAPSPESAPAPEQHAASTVEVPQPECALTPSLISRRRWPSSFW